MGFKIKKTVNGETVWEPIKAKKYTSSKTIEYTGTLPITINTDGNALIDYQIYGNTEQTGTPTPENPIVPVGVGERTENLVNVDDIALLSNNRYGIVIDTPGTYTFSAYNITQTYVYVRAYDSSDSPISDNLAIVSSTGTVITRTLTITQSEHILLFDPISNATLTSVKEKFIVDNVLAVEGSTAPTSYIPYGYKLPMVSRGENLWNSELEQGTFDISTGEERDASERIRSDYIHIQNSDNYTITLTGAEGVVVYVYDANKSFLSAESTVEWQALPFTREIEANRYVRFAFAKSASGDYYEKITPSDVSNIMLVKGSTAPESYIPYYREETPIYLGEVPTTRRIKKLVLTGAENWGITGNDPGYTPYFRITYFTSAKLSKVVCTHYISPDENISVSNEVKGIKIQLSASYGTVLIVRPPEFAVWSLADFKSYLAAQYAAGTPVTVWYVLAEPETGIENEPLMKIGNYTDTVGMEQTGVSIPTNNGSTVIDYNGTLKPSQMYVKYNSWSGWSDIDDYKMVNGDWTQEMT